MSQCKFDKSWAGKCTNAEPCEEYKDLLCVSCSQPATHACGETGVGVCNEPLCESCEHATTEGGTNGLGFSDSPPEGWKFHVKKGEQKYQPWYMREGAFGGKKEDKLAAARG